MNRPMNRPLPPHLKTTNKHYAWVLATAHDMVEESLYHCHTFAMTLEAHHNPTAAELFKAFLPKLETERALIEQASKGIQLPPIPPWEVPHLEYQHPAPSLMNAHYLTSETEAWKTLDELIRVHSCFYEHLLNTHQQQESQALVQTLIAHCRQLHKQCQQALNNSPHETPPIDDDPPNLQG